MIPQGIEKPRHYIPSYRIPCKIRDTIVLNIQFTYSMAIKWWSNIKALYIKGTEKCMVHRGTLFGYCIIGTNSLDNYGTTTCWKNNKYSTSNLNFN